MYKNKFYVIDAHCHVYPQKILPRAVDATGDFYLEKPFHNGTLEQLFEYGDAMGIDKYVIESVATTKNQVPRINEFIAECVSKYPDRLYGLGAAHPESDDIRKDMEQVKALGLKGIKIHPDIQGFSIDCDGFKETYDACEELGLTVLSHAGDKRYDYSNPNRIVPLLLSRPNLKFVAAHLGGWSIWSTAVDELQKIPNLYVDCSSALGYISPEKATEIIRRFGADHVLFGTDYPLHSIDGEFAHFDRLLLTDEERKMIFCENAKRIYGLD